MSTHYIYNRINAPNAYIDIIGSGNVILQSPRPNTMMGLICRDGTPTIGNLNKTNIIPNDVELGIPSSDDLIITEDVTYNDQNIINNLTVDGCVFTISEISDLTVLNGATLLNGGSIVGTYSTTPITNGDLEVLGELNLHNS